jgi:hypothetical protein
LGRNISQRKLEKRNILLDYFTNLVIHGITQVGLRNRPFYVIPNLRHGALHKWLLSKRHSAKMQCCNQVLNDECRGATDCLARATDAKGNI